MTTTPHDAAALRHYEALIALRYPPQLAALLAAARYAHGLGVEQMPPHAVAQAVEADPEIRREAGRALAATERRRRKAG